MRQHDRQASTGTAQDSRHILVRGSLASLAWEFFLLLACLALGSISLSHWQTLWPSTSPPPQDVLVLMLSVTGTLLALWNLVNAAIAHLGTLRTLPGWARLLCTSFISHWGTAYARQILLRSGAQLAVGVGSFTVGLSPLAFAADLPAPEIPTVDTPMSATMHTPDSRALFPDNALPSPLLSALSLANTSDSAQSAPSALASSDTTAPAADAHAPNPLPPAPAHAIDEDNASAETLGTPTTDSALTPPRSHTSAPSANTNPVAQDARRRMEQALPQQHSVRPSTPPSATPAASPQRSSLSRLSHTVISGECLWSIAADLLPEHSTNADIARAWQEIYSLNRSSIGPNPDLILPGTVLSLPTTP